MVEKEVIDGSSCSKNGDDMFLERGMQPEEIGLLYDTGKDSRSKTNHRAKRCLRGRRFFIGCAEVVGWSCRAYLHGKCEEINHLTTDPTKDLLLQYRFEKKVMAHQNSPTKLHTNQVKVNLRVPWSATSPSISRHVSGCVF